MAPEVNSFINVINFFAIFRNCNVLTGMLVGIFANCLNETDFSQTFLICSGLTGNAPLLWITHSGVTNSDNCFTGCNRLTNYNSIPNNWR